MTRKKLEIEIEDGIEVETAVFDGDQILITYANEFGKRFQAVFNTWTCRELK